MPALFQMGHQHFRPRLEKRLAAFAGLLLKLLAAAVNRLLQVAD